MAELGSWSWDLETGATRWSAGLLRLFGVADADGHTYDAHDRLVHPDDAEAVRDALRAWPTTASRSTSPTGSPAPTGSSAPLHGRGAPTELVGGRIRRVSGTTQDVTERHRLEAGRREAEARFRAAFEHAPIGVCVLGFDGDDPGQWLTVNPALAGLLGHTARTLLGSASAGVAPGRAAGDPPAAPRAW